MVKKQKWYIYIYIFKPIGEATGKLLWCFKILKKKKIKSPGGDPTIIITGIGRTFQCRPWYVHF